jgi:DNA-binding transcriptional LysR family regulator
VFEYRSISAAARKLAIAQPALSRSLRNAERIVGAKLFDRGSLGVVPTEYGRALVRYYFGIEANLRHAADEIEEIRGVTSTMMQIGVGPIEGLTIVAPALTRLFKRQPLAQATIREGLYVNFEPALASGALDVIIGGEPRSGIDSEIKRGLEFELLGHLRPAIVVRSQHPLAKKRKVSLQDLQRATWIVASGNTATGNRFRKVFIDEGLRPPSGQLLAPVSSWTAIGFLQRNNVVAMLPEPLIKHELDSGALRALKIDREIFDRPVYLVRRKDAVFSSTYEYFFDDVRDVCKTLGGTFS